MTEITVILLIVVLTGTMIASGFVIRRLRKMTKMQASLETRARIQERDRFKTTVDEFSRIISMRTGLSNELYNIALRREGTPGFGFEQDVAKFLNSLINSTERMFTSLTGAQCAASIKLFVPKSSDPTIPLIKTLYRDDFSNKKRKNIYDQVEPFDISKNSLFKELMESKPSTPCVICNNLSQKKPAYHSQYPDWKDIQSASVVHLIKDPDDDNFEEIYGFLCVDNTAGNFDEEITRAILSTVANVIYYCISASSVIELAHSINEDNK